MLPLALRLKTFRSKYNLFFGMRFKNYSDRYPRLLAWGIFVWIIFSALPAYASKILIKTWDASEIKKVEVFAAHAYRIDVTTHLGSGNCHLYQFMGNANLISESGAIDVGVLSNTSGEAYSQAGKVVNNLPKKGRFRIKAESVKGDISLIKTPE